MSWAMICNETGCTEEALTDGLCRSHQPPRHQKRIPVRQMVEELDWIVGTDWPDNIARRLGYTSTGSLERRLYTIARTYPDLDRAVAHARRLHNYSKEIAA